MLPQLNVGEAEGDLEGAVLFVPPRSDHDDDDDDATEDAGCHARTYIDFLKIKQKDTDHYIIEVIWYWSLCYRGQLILITILSWSYDTDHYTIEIYW